MIYFDSNLEKGQETYKKTFSKYPSFKIGIVLLMLIAAGVAGSIYLAIERFYPDWTIEQLLPHIMVCVCCLTCIYPAILILLMGKKRQLVKIPEEVISIFSDHISIEYIPAGKKPKYALIRTNIYYCDIKKIEYQSTKERIRINSLSQTEKFKELKEESDYDDRIIEEAKENDYYIYNRYADIELILRKIEEASMRKASYVQ